MHFLSKKNTEDERYQNNCFFSLYQYLMNIYLTLLSSVDEDKQVIQSKINEKDWIIEVERVAPKLRLQVKNEAKEWRSHIEQTKEYNNNIRKILPDARTRLEKLVESLS